jgi:hypothetical protein
MMQLLPRSSMLWADWTGKSVVADLQLCRCAVRWYIIRVAPSPSLLAPLPSVSPEIATVLPV